jgi:leucine dehydrogenase
MTTPWGFADYDAHEALHFFDDENSGLKAIIAVHSTHLGPAAGGARFWYYENEAEAVTDALRLSRGMSYKNAMAGLALGGGKSVLMAPKDRSKTPELLAAFGKAVESICGRYVTAEDVGMSVQDMIEVRRQTQYVAGLPVEGGAVGGDPGPHTSLGVFLGLKAAVKRALGKDSVDGLHIALQGAGSVASGVAMHAAAEGARLSIADVDTAKAQKLADAVKGTVVDPSDILTLEADVLSPNALGAILTEQSIANLRVPIVAGGANNQLQEPERAGWALHQRGILYAPDFVGNAGGLINVYNELLGYNKERAMRMARGIFHNMARVFEISAADSIPSYQAADRMAEERIEKIRHMRPVYWDRNIRRQRKL